MTLEEIKQAVLDGKTVHWSNTNYSVVKDDFDQWLIECNNGHCIGLTWSDGKKLQGRECDYYVPLSSDERLTNLELAVNDAIYELLEIAKKLDSPEDFEYDDAYIAVKEAAWGLKLAIGNRK